MMPILPIMNLSRVAVVCRIDLYRRSLWHGLAWRWHSKNDTGRNGRGHGQNSDAKHDKILLFIEDTDALTTPAHDRIPSDCDVHLQAPGTIAQNPCESWSVEAPKDLHA
jgi:hypothetical protein